MSNFYRGQILPADELNSEFSLRVSRSGDTMTGPLMLSRDPQQPMEAVTKQFIDNLPPPQASGVATFNARIGNVTLTALDVTTALTYTPYNATNPSGYQTAAQVSAALPVASSTLPSMDGTAIVGVGTTWARADHTHPTDTTRYAASNPAGYVTSAGAASAAPVQSVATRTGAVTLTHNDITDWATTLLPYALLASPILTGDPRAPTPAPGDNDTSIATTAFVTSAVSAGTAGVASFNTRTGAVVLNSADVTTALTYTPYNATNPSGYQTAAQVTAVLPVASSTTPLMDNVAAVGSGTTWARADHVHPVDTSRYAATNPSGYQTSAQVTAVLPVASSTLPLVAGTAAIGASAKYAREDHVHPVSVVTVADTPPTIANGLLWFDSVGTHLYIGYNDGNSTQWVLIA